MTSKDLRLLFLASFPSRGAKFAKRLKGWGDHSKVGRAVLFFTGKSFTVDGLREKLRDFFREEVRS
jgi:hypothetical protein